MLFLQLIFSAFLLQSAQSSCLGFLSTFGNNCNNHQQQQQQQQQSTTGRVGRLKYCSPPSWRLFTTATTSSTTTRDDDVTSPIKIGTITFLIPLSEQGQQRLSRFGQSSPVGNPTLLEAVQQLSLKCSWCTDDRVDAFIVPVPSSKSLLQEKQMEMIRQDLMETDILIAYGLSDEHDVEFASHLFELRREQRSDNQRQRQCQFAIDCTTTAVGKSSKRFPVFCGPYDDRFPDLQSVFVPWTKAATGRRLAKQMKQLFQRDVIDEWVLGILLFWNYFSGSEIEWVKHTIDATWEKGPLRNILELVQMVSMCGDCITECVQDDSCRNCLNKLTETDTRDQVASYRTIVSFESDLLRDFSFCILQKNNIFGCDATIPTLPQVSPLALFRGKSLTNEVARGLLVGHLEGEEVSSLPGSLETPVSWIVTLGANEAYDQFPSQHQLFYPAERGKDMWYDPVFRVETLDGRNVWCKRHYKVRPQTVPGTFRFSVLDNGVTSDEFWTIVAAADDLSWIVFHYAGAASAVGLRYVGGLVCTPDGTMPNESEWSTIWDAVRAGGFQPWELYTCNNDFTSPGYLDAGPPPLNFFRDKILAQRAARSAGSTEL